ncbi:MAG: aminotransferase class V-fold PLP-dependent enzyme [Dactylosporangium sp.]|nr:aminotransferase class V-fold PLP-dependent enzyme [Dactylosporangium sp.]NNJ59942.1 aminotransferase class V-fold PLP-dependent enzyme [Dactylosporangium sp.]
MLTSEAPPPLPGSRLLFSLDAAIAHLDHGSFGATPLTVQRAQRRMRDEMEANPAGFFDRGLPERLAHTRRHLSSFVGADPDSCAFVANAGVAVALVLRSMALDEGDDIVTTDHGHPAVAAAVARACAATGARHQVATVSLAGDGPDVVTAVRSVLTARTRLVIVDHVTPTSARVFPVADLTRAVHQAGPAVLVDASHVPGALTANARETGADFWVGDLHTWAFAPRPTALLAVTWAWRERLWPQPTPERRDSGYPDVVEPRGTIDYTSWLAAPAGLFALRSLGLETVWAHNRALAEYGQQVVGRALGLDRSQLPSSGGPSELPMRIIPLPEGIAATPVAARTLRHRIAEDLRTETAISVWRGRAVLRLSAQVYNRAEEYERLAAGLPDLLGAAHGQR